MNTLPEPLSPLLRTFLCLAFLFTVPGLVSADDYKKTSPRGPKDTGKVLIFSGTGWYRHPETAAISGWLARLADDVGMQIDVTEHPKDLERLLDRYQVLILNNANALDKILTERQRKKVEDWYNDGGGIVALHAALVRQTEWKWLTELGGCDFDSDSDFVPAKVIVDPAGKDHPTVKDQGETFTYTADWTNHDKAVTGQPGIQVLLRVDETSFEPVRDWFQERGGKPMGKDHPVAWINTLNDGRFFYTDLGHDVRSLDTPFGKQHIVEAIRWAARLSDEPADAKAKAAPGTTDVPVGPSTKAAPAKTK